jgi:2-haloacid dehalogenase
MDVIPPRVCVFDVNETLLDLRALDPHFQRAFGDAAFRQSWFNQLLQSALVATVTNTYADFGTIARAALVMTAERASLELSDADQSQILDAMQELPAHPEVPVALERLRGAGLRLAALTNSTTLVAEAALDYAGLREYFEQILSADAVRRLKPAPEPYRMAAERLGVPIDRIRLIAAHSWDVAGALRTGCAAAFVARPGMVLDPLAARPDIVGADLTEIADHLLEHETPVSDLHPW